MLQIIFLQNFSGMLVLIMVYAGHSLVAIISVIGLKQIIKAKILAA